MGTEIQDRILLLGLSHTVAEKKFACTMKLFLLFMV